MGFLLSAPRWLYEVIGGAVLAILLVVAYNHHVNSVVTAAVNANTQELTEQFAKDKAKAIEDETKRSQLIVEQVKEEYDARIKTIKVDAGRMVNNHISGAGRLYVPVKTCTIGASDNSGTQSNPAGVDATSRAELSDESVRFFVAEAERADKQAVQLNSLIDVVEKLKLGH